MFRILGRKFSEIVNQPILYCNQYSFPQYRQFTCPWPPQIAHFQRFLKILIKILLKNFNGKSKFNIVGNIYPHKVVHRSNFLTQTLLLKKVGHLIQGIFLSLAPLHKILLFLPKTHVFSAFLCTACCSILLILRNFD